MSAEYTPGPWQIGKGRTLVDRPYWVWRNVSPRSSFSHFEQLRDDNGVLLTFASEQEARAAVAKATGSAS